METLTSNPTIKVGVMEPGQPIEFREIPNTLDAMHAIVGGWLEGVSLYGHPHLTVLCNEEGKLLGLPPNFLMRGDVIAGTVVFTWRNRAGDWEDLPEKVIDILKAIPLIRL